MIQHGKPISVNPQRVVLIGARGFLGTTIGRELTKSGICTAGLTSAAIDLTESDATDKLAGVLRPTDTVVVLSAITPDKGRDVSTTVRNMKMMQSICDALIRTGCAHLVYFSSDAVYGSSATDVSEKTTPAPDDLYGAMHLARELMAKSLRDVPLLVLRPTMVYGTGDTHNAYGPNRFVHTAMTQRQITLFGKGEETRDHIHAEDVARITVECLVHQTTGLLNLVTGKSPSFRQVADLICENIGSFIDIRSAPRTVPIRHRNYDISGLAAAFPDFRPLDIAQGIARVLADHPVSGATRGVSGLHPDRTQ